MLRTAALAVIVWAAAAVAPAYALTPERQMELLRTYQPVTFFSAAELFTPTDVGGFESNARLRWQNTAGSFTGAPPGSINPTPEEIAAARNSQCQPALRDPCWILDESNCAASGGTAPATLACYQNAWQATGPQLRTYGRVFHGNSGWALQYWYFYYDRAFEPQVSGRGSTTYSVQHEGDWESVTVVLSPDRTPRLVGLANHCLGLRRSWGAAPRIGRHPIARVARGSHAAWYGNGAKRVPRKADCLSASENAALDAGRVRISDTVTPGSVSGPPGLPGLGTYHPTGLVLLTHSQPWIAYPGAWGEREFADITANGATVVSGEHGFSPRGPSHMGRIWTHPIGVASHWPRTYRGFR